MGVKCPKKGAKWRLLREHATLLFMTQLLYCQMVALIVVKEPERQIATTIYSISNHRQSRWYEEGPLKGPDFRV